MDREPGEGIPATPYLSARTWPSPRCAHLPPGVSAESWRVVCGGIRGEVRSGYLGSLPGNVPVALAGEQWSPYQTPHELSVRCCARCDAGLRVLVHTPEEVPVLHGGYPLVLPLRHCRPLPHDLPGATMAWRMLRVILTHRSRSLRRGSQISSGDNPVALHSRTVLSRVPSR